MTPFAVPCDGKLPLPFWQVSEIVLLFLQNSRMAPQTPEFLAESGDFKHLPRSTVQLEDETGKVPSKEKVEEVFLLARVMYKAVLGLHYQRKEQKKQGQLAIF